MRSECPAGVRTVQADLDDLIAIIRPLAQHLHGAIRDLFPHTRDKEPLRSGEVVEPQKTEKPQIEDQQPAHGQRREDVGGKAFVVGQRVLGIEVPQGAVTEGFHHHHHFACQHQPLLLPQELRPFAQRFQGRAVHQGDEGNASRTGAQLGCGRGGGGWACMRVQTSAKS